MRANEGGRRALLVGLALALSAGTSACGSSAKREYSRRVVVLGDSVFFLARNVEYLDSLDSLVVLSRRDSAFGPQLARIQYLLPILRRMAGDIEATRPPEGYSVVHLQLVGAVRGIAEKFRLLEAQERKYRESWSLGSDFYRRQDAYDAAKEAYEAVSEEQVYGDYMAARRRLGELLRDDGVEIARPDSVRPSFR